MLNGGVYLGIQELGPVVEVILGGLPGRLLGHIVIFNMVVFPQTQILVLLDVPPYQSSQGHNGLVILAALLRIVGFHEIADPASVGNVLDGAVLIDQTQPLGGRAPFQGLPHPVFHILHDLTAAPLGVFIAARAVCHGVAVGLEGLIVLGLLLLAAEGVKGAVQAVGIGAGGRDLPVYLLQGVCHILGA